MVRSSRPRRWAAGVLALALAAALGLTAGPSEVAVAEPEINLTGPAPIEQRSASTVTADALPTVQLDTGIAWTQTVVGNIVYVGGSFSNARPYGAAQGTNLTPRQNLLAYDITTGNLVPGWAPSVNGTVKTITASPDGRRIYVGGTFTKANGETRFNIAAFDAATGALVPAFKPSSGGSYVNAIVATGDAVYVGGLLGAGNGVVRKNLMAFNTSGQLLGWAPTTDLQVDTMVVAPGTGKLIVGGRFGVVNNVPQRGLVALGLTDGQIQPWEAPTHVRNGVSEGTYKGKAGIFSLASDGTSVFGTGWVYAAAEYGNFEGVFSAQPESGALNWVADCHGDHYGVYSDTTTVYSTSHEHSCESMGGFPQKNPAPGNMRNATAITAERKGTLTRATGTPFYQDWTGYPAPAAINWYPDWYTGTASGQGQAGWSVVGTGKYIAVGGEFRGVNGRAQYGLVRFSSDPSTGANEGPRLSGDAWTPTATSPHSGSVRLSIPANWDRDDLALSYEVLRDGTKVGTVAGKSSFWNLPTLAYNDTTVAAAKTYRYQIRAKDGDGNTALSKVVDVTTSTTTLPAYSKQVVDDGALLYWRLNRSTTAEVDLIGTDAGNARSGVSASTPGALVGDPDAAAAFDGTGEGTMGSTRLQTAPQVYSTELWFSTTSNRGGKLSGFGSSPLSPSGSYDRHVYMDNQGHLTFGAYPGAVRVATTEATYNDGAWHHVVATQSDAGMRLYVDGAVVATNANTAAQPYDGYWRVGGDNMNGWPSVGSSSFLAGKIDEFAVYGNALAPETVAEHYQLGRAVTPPTATFTAAVDDQDVTVDGRGSSAPAGRTITGYSWNFGDQTPAVTGATASHHYAEPGTYAVTLTVTDSTGATATTERSVTATAPHPEPVAAIDHDAAGLTVAFDSSGSTAAGEATITARKWEFGDGATSTAAAPSHRYETAGAYTVKLTVTDSTGATGSATESVTVTHADPVAAFDATTPAARTVEVDGSGSTASDGATLSYSWAWGDGSAAGSGRTASHQYAQSGDYDVKLTVTDSLGASATVTKTVSVTAETIVASDSFTRAVTSGWGSADTGGAWTGTTGASVVDGAGLLTVGRTQTRTVTLPGAEAEDSVSRFAVAPQKVADGGGVHLNYGVRKDAAGEYRLKLRYAANGTVNVGIARLVNGSETLLTSRALTGYTQQAGGVLQVRLEAVSSGSSTTLRARAWADGQSEPTTWLVTASDAQTELQDAGGLGFSAYGTGTITNGPIGIAVDDLEVR